MARIWREYNEIPWICNSEEEDFMANVAGYCLRVEQLDKGIWWWEVSYLGKQIATTLNDTTETRGQAIGRAEGVFTMHRQTNINGGTEIRFFKSTI